MKAVICLETSEIFRSERRASQWLGCSRQALNNHLSGKAKCCGGFHFKLYTNKNELEDKKSCSK